MPRKSKIIPTLHTTMHILLGIFSVICCCIFLLGYFYFCAQAMFGNFSLRQFVFHIAAVTTMDFSASLVTFVLLPFVSGGFLILFSIKNPVLWLRLYVSKTVINSLNKSKYLISFATSVITGLIGLVLLSSGSVYSLPQVFQQAKYVYDLWNGQQQYDTIIDENYTSPEHLQISLNQPHNLIVIFAESMEKNFENADVFGENLLPQLQNQQGTFFEQAYELSETNWTQASLIATLCGITSKLYLPPRPLSEKMVCISDILDKYGYNIYAIQGSPLKFAGTDDFLKTHKFTKIEGTDELTQIPTDKIYNINFIGQVVEDSVLLEIFKNKVVSLYKQSKPFMAIAVTMSTHPFHGHTDRQCTEKYQDMRDAILCSDAELSSFVEWFKMQDLAKNTTLIIMGDHLMMYTDIQNLLDTIKNRQALNLMWGYGAPKQNISKPFNQFDWAPTLLEMAGFQWNGHKFALGTSLLSAEQTLQEIFGKSLNKRLLNNSKIYESEFTKNTP